MIRRRRPKIVAIYLCATDTSPANSVEALTLMKDSLEFPRCSWGLSLCQQNITFCDGLMDLVPHVRNRTNYLNRKRNTRNSYPGDHVIFRIAHTTYCCRTTCELACVDVIQVELRGDGEIGNTMERSNQVHACDEA